MACSEVIAPGNPVIEPAVHTVVSCELVITTQSRQPLAPNAQIELDHAFKLAVSELAAGYGARILLLKSGGALIAFGPPKTRADAAKSGVQASLNLVQAINESSIPAGVGREIRIGIASGLIATVKQGRPRVETIDGLAIDIATTLRGLAGPGQIVVADITKRLIADKFHFEDMGNIQFIGWGQRTWQVTAIASSRFEQSQFEIPLNEAPTGPPAADAPFPSFKNFVQTYEPRKRDAEFGGQSTYDGSVTVTLLRPDLVKGVLPVGFRLADRTDGGTDHPIIHIVGHQNNCALLQEDGSLKQLGESYDYDEMALLIPFIVSTSGTKMHAFSVRMYLDRWPPIIIGNDSYAYAKKWADLNESSDENGLTTDVLPQTSRSLYFRSQVGRTGPWRSCADAQAAIPRWPDLKEIFKLPIIGVHMGPDGIPRSRVCSYWELDYTKAEVAPARSQHQFFHPFRDGMDDWPDLGLLQNAPDGCVAIRNLRWRLASPPLDCDMF